MTKNVGEKVACISNCSAFISLCAIVVLSFVDVVPRRQESLAWLFYVCGGVFAVSLIVSVSLAAARFFRRNGEGIHEAKDIRGKVGKFVEGGRF